MRNERNKKKFSSYLALLALSQLSVICYFLLKTDTQRNRYTCQEIELKSGSFAGDIKILHKEY